MKALRQRFAATLAGMIIAQIATAATYIVLARTAGPSTYGHAMAAVGVAGAAVALLDFGSAAYHLRTAHRMHSSAQDTNAIRHETHEWVTQRLTTALVGSVALGSIMAALGDAFFGAAAANLFALTLSSVTQTAYQAGHRFAAGSLSTTIERTVWLGLTLILIKIGASLQTCLTLAPLLATAGAFLALTPFDGYLFQGFRKALRTNPWHGTFHFGVNSVAVGMLSLDIPLVRTFSSPLAAGEFAAVNKWVQPFNLLSTAYSRSAFPHLVSTNRTEAFKALRSGTPFLAGATVLAAALAASSPLLVAALLGRGYEGSAATFALLMLSVPSMMMNQPLGLFLQSQGREKTSSRIMLVSIAWQLTAVALLSNAFGSTGAALGFSCGQYTLTTALIIAIRKPTRTASPMNHSRGVILRLQPPRINGPTRPTKLRHSASRTRGRAGNRKVQPTSAPTSEAGRPHGRARSKERHVPTGHLPGSWSVGAFAWTFIFSEGLMYGLKAESGLAFLNATYLAYVKFAAAFIFILGFSLTRSGTKASNRPAPNLALACYLIVAVSYLAIQTRLTGPSPVPLFIQYTLAIALPAVALGSVVRAPDLLKAAPFGTWLGFAALILFIPSSLRSDTGESAVNIGLNDVGGATHLLVGQTAAISLITGLSLLTFRSTRLTLLSVANSLLAIYLLISSGSRGGLVSAAVAAPILLWLSASASSKGHTRRLSRGWVLGFVFGAVVIGTVALRSIGSTSEAAKKFTSLFAGGDRSTQIRQQYYEASWAAIQQHPIFGSGPASFARSMGEYLYPHQVFLEVWADFGIVGVLVGCTLVLRALRRSARQGLAGALLTGQLVAALVMLQFSGTFTTSYLMWFFLACAYTNATVSDPPRLPLRSGAGKYTQNSRKPHARRLH